MSMPSFIIKILRDYFRWVLLAVVLIVVGLGYGLLLNKKIARIQTISFTDRNKAKTELDASISYAGRLEKSLDTFHSSFTAAELDHLNRVLPPATDFPELLLSIKKMAATANLELTSITMNSAGSVNDPAPDPDAEVPDVTIPKIQAIDISIQVDKGTGYDQFKYFLSIIESSERIYDVRSLNFSQPSSKVGETVPYIMILRTYVMPAAVPPTT